MPINADEARKIAQEVVTNGVTNKQYSAVPTSFHTHNGIDSNKFPFLNLKDVPNSYSGQAGNAVVVNSTETGLDFETVNTSIEVGDPQQPSLYSAINILEFVGTSLTNSSLGTNAIQITVKRIIEAKVISDSATLATGDGQLFICVPQLLDSYFLVEANAFVSTVSSSGTPTIQVRNSTSGDDMLSTPITIDENEFTSYTATVPPVIDGAHKTVAVGDLIAIDVDVSGTGAKGLGVILMFIAPFI